MYQYYNTVCYQQENPLSHSSHASGTRISGVGRSEAGNPTDMSAELEEPQHLQNKTPLVIKKVLQL